MLSPEFLTRAYRRVKSRRTKALAVAGMRLLRMRYLVIRIDTTNLCNLRCRMCYYSAEKPRKRQEMDPDLFQRIARDVFGRTRFLYLSCATEPLMNRDFPAFLDCTAEHRVPFTSFCTNGMLLTEPVVDSAIAAGLSEIIFSVDGATPQTYEYIRRGAKWDKLLAALDLLHSKKARAGADRPVGRINFTCMKRNIAEMPALIGLAAEHGVGNVHVRHLLAFGDGDGEMTAAEQMAYKTDFNRIARETQSQADRLAVRLFLPDPIPQAQPPPAAAPRPANTARREANPYCLIPWFEFIINPVGDVRLCSAFPPFGNLREQSFDEIYNGPRIKDLRRRLLRRSPDACSWTCSQEAYDVSPEPGGADADAGTNTKP